LFVKHHQNFCQAKSLVFGGANFHLLTMETEVEVEKFLATEEVDVILVDCRKDKDGGFDFVEKLRRAQPSVRVVLVADHFDLNSVVRGIRLGLKDVHTPPLDFGAVLANLIEFTALSRERRSAFSAGITSHLVDFLQGREVKAPERSTEAVADSGAAGPASGKKVVLKTKFTSLVAEQAKTRGLTGQLAKELEALEVRKVELDRREAALKSRESTAAGRGRPKAGAARPSGSGP
jgi:DNA-binding response OmpR family regulator